MKRKGFTMSELLVTLAVTGVILVSIFSMVTSISTFQSRQHQRSLIQEELTLVRTRMSDWFSARDVYTNPNPTVSPDGRTLAFDNVEVSEKMSFEPANKALILGEETFSCQYITQITFEASGGLVKCTLSYTLEDVTDTYVFMLLKRSQST